MTQPSPAFAGVSLRTITLPAGARCHRLYDAHFPDPRGFQRPPQRGSRFSCPAGYGKPPYAVVYFGTDMEVCVLETIVRDTRNCVVGASPITMATLARYRFATYSAQQPLTLIDLTGGNCVAMGIPTDVPQAARHALGQAWSAAFHDHPSAVDGIWYRSRLCERRNICLFERAVAKLAPLHGARQPMLIDRRHAAELVRILKTYALELT